MPHNDDDDDDFLEYMMFEKSCNSDKNSKAGCGCGGCGSGCLTSVLGVLAALYFVISLIF